MLRADEAITLLSLLREALAGATPLSRVNEEG
jgi:hypothetical protein